jgi:hypothetical protein
VIGTPTDNASRFDVNLNSDPGFIALHIAIHFKVNWQIQIYQNGF